MNAQYSASCGSGIVHENPAIQPNIENPDDRDLLEVCPLSLCAFEGCHFHAQGRACGLRRVCKFYARGECRFSKEACNDAHVKFSCKGMVVGGICDVFPEDDEYVAHRLMYEHGEDTVWGDRINGVRRWLYLHTLFAHHQNLRGPAILSFGREHVCPGDAICPHPPHMRRPISQQQIFELLLLEHRALLSIVAQPSMINNNGNLVLPTYISPDNHRCALGSAAALMEVSTHYPLLLYEPPSEHQVMWRGRSVFGGNLQTPRQNALVHFKQLRDGFKVEFQNGAGTRRCTFRTGGRFPLESRVDLNINHLPRFVGEHLLMEILSIIHPVESLKTHLNHGWATVTYSTASHAQRVMGLLEGFPLGGSRLRFSYTHDTFWRPGSEDQANFKGNNEQSRSGFPLAQVDGSNNGTSHDTSSIPNLTIEPQNQQVDAP